MGHPPEQVLVVLNRAGTNVGISDSEAVQILGRTPDVFVPSDREIPISINDGVPLTLSGSRSLAAQAINSLADMFVQDEVAGLAGKPASLKVKQRRRLFRRKPVTSGAGLASGH
jgi:pilus assembly protein CpaE